MNKLIAIQNISMHSESNISYHITFKVTCKVNFGEILAVSGSLDELGCWKSFHHTLKWSENNIWVSEEPLITNKAHFSYKYIMLGPNKNILNWEQGINRIADMEKLY